MHPSERNFLFFLKWNPGTFRHPKNEFNSTPGTRNTITKVNYIQEFITIVARFNMLLTPIDLLLST